MARRREPAPRLTSGPDAPAIGAATGVEPARCRDATARTRARRPLPSLLDQIGAGGMGSVWRARDLRTGAGRRGQGARRATTPRCCCASCTSSRCGSGTRTCSPRPAGPPRTTSSCSPWTWCAAARSHDLLAEHGPLPERVRRGAARPAAPGAGGRARRRGRAPRRQAGQPAARADRDARPHLRLGDFGVARPGRRRPVDRADRPWSAPTATWRPSGCAARRRPAPGPVRRRRGRRRAAHRPSAPPGTRAPAGPARGRCWTSTRPQPRRRRGAPPSVGAALGHLRARSAPAGTAARGDAVVGPLVARPARRTRSPACADGRRWPLVG